MTEVAQQRRAFISGNLRKAGAQGPKLSRFQKEVQGDVFLDLASRGRYATDASIYQLMPIAVVVPKTALDARVALDLAREMNLPVLPRGAGTSQCGQTVGEALVIDHSKYLNKVLAFDQQALTITVEPGMVLDHLNAFLKPYGLWFPVDVSTAAQCTIGGMTGNNSCGSRSFLWLAIALLRQHGAQRGRHSCCVGRWHRGLLWPLR